MLILIYFWKQNHSIRQIYDQLLHNENKKQTIPPSASQFTNWKWVNQYKKNNNNSRINHEDLDGERWVGSRRMLDGRRVLAPLTNS